MSWACRQDGRCCQEPGEVVVTPAERDLLLRACSPFQAERAVFLPHADPRFVRLQAGPCPFYAEGCTVYEHRPYNCRRYLCGREVGQPFVEGVPARFFTDRPFRRLMVQTQRKAQTWARAQGWTE